MFQAARLPGSQFVPQTLGFQAAPEDSGIAVFATCWALCYEVRTRRGPMRFNVANTVQGLAPTLRRDTSEAWLTAAAPTMRAGPQLAAISIKSTSD